jgi:hypothetical protein
MARVKWNPEKKSPDKEPLPVVWGCELFMRANGTFETFFKGQTGFEMMKAAVEALHAIEQLRRSPLTTLAQTGEKAESRKAGSHPVGPRKATMADHPQLVWRGTTRVLKPTA